MIIAIDPSYNKKLGIAWYDTDIHFASIGDSKNYKKATRNVYLLALQVLDFISSLLNEDEPNTIIIEGQFCGVNKAMFANLVEIRALICGMILAKYRNSKVSIQVVQPNVWQNKIFKQKLRSADCKIASMEIAKDLTKQAPTEDESDAICILQYALEKITNN